MVNKCPAEFITARVKAEGKVLLNNGCVS